MKKKINFQFMLLATIAVITTLIVTTVVYFGVYQEEVMEDLSLYAGTLVNTHEFDGELVLPATQDKLNSLNIRVTLVKSNGEVLYDNDADADSMQNHLNRPEIKLALKKGTGEAVRKSETINALNYYYALRLDNGNVLRVARESGSIFKLVEHVIPLIFVLAGVLLIGSYFVSHFLTKSLIKPIEEMAENLDQIDRIESYKELVPVTNLIRSQHEDILRSANIRQDFTANVSHELKTPLTAISGYAELIESGMATQENIPRFANEIKHNAKRLLHLINDIIELSEYDTLAEENITLSDVDLSELIENALHDLAISAKEHDVQLFYEKNFCVVKANKDMMEEVIFNLVDNAIRYDLPGGHVWIETHGKLVVRDDGIGISHENQKRIY